MVQGFLFQPMAFSSHLQGHRSCILGEAYASSYFRLSGPRTPPHPAQTLFTKFARRPGCAGRRISNPDYLCFSLSTRRPGLLPASAIFKLCAAVSSAFFLFISPFVFGLVSWVLGLGSSLSVSLIAASGINSDHHLLSASRGFIRKPTRSAVDAGRAFADVHIEKRPAEVHPTGRKKSVLIRGCNELKILPVPASCRQGCVLLLCGFEISC